MYIFFVKLNRLIYLKIVFSIYIYIYKRDENYIFIIYRNILFSHFMFDKMHCTSNIIFKYLLMVNV